MDVTLSSKGIRVGDRVKVVEAPYEGETGEVIQDSATLAFVAIEGWKEPQYFSARELERIPRSQDG